jgi:hypothetical protein
MNNNLYIQNRCNNDSDCKNNRVCIDRNCQNAPTPTWLLVIIVFLLVIGVFVLLMTFGGDSRNTRFIYKL